MTYRLSLLDKSPIRAGEDAAEALKQTVRLARRAEELGYHRFWVAEHHNSTELASAAPEVLVSWILANTSRIRVGSGGVMLQHYSPYKVAEVFNVLASLAPGRVDLGVGKTPGGLPLATSALQAAYDPDRKPGFEERLAALETFLSGPAPANSPFAGLSATPRPPAGTEKFLLGASPASARLAAGHGWDYVHAGHLNGDTENLKASLETYRKESGRAPILALSAFASENAGHANAQVTELKIYKVFLSNGTSFSLGRREQAEEFARQAGDDNYRIEERRPNVLAGTAETIHAELSALSLAHGIEEFIIEPPPVAAEERLAAVELLARTPIPAAA
ncbi:MsnO8 family LLM class oxidoreductase [Rhizobiaceae bacterium BDR2-2]|uniref:MsnO8 family LLM class oxidoreductase n=1 Tax=Ectorhizobium quercum TaxID=2965071 RepID=A0AAE3SWQ4_9HYPH|nr:MsnO8 family LLM class oxidoreductase [Ectorhizobium quercum]MCX8999650.1 MsnO8 family LLM class oxidoreductase [Ectorhizobium quercum]